MSLLRFAERADRAASPQALFELLAEEAGRYAFEYIAYGQLGQRSGVDPALPYPAVMLNYPPDWQSYYAARRYQHVDPVVTFAPLTAKPFAWADLLATRQLDPHQRRVFADAEAFGLRDGVSVPLHGPGGRVGMLSFAASKPAPPRPQGVLHMLAVIFDLAFQTGLSKRSRQAAALRLTSRERECLNWTAHGKSSWDIALILGIGQETVRFHLKNAMRKLQVRSRTVAVVKALRLGLIDPFETG